jgi:hypothetical protein
MTTNVYKDGHSQILFKDKKREIYMYVFIMSNREKEEEFTHISHTQEGKCVSSFRVL